MWSLPDGWMPERMRMKTALLNGGECSKEMETGKQRDEETGNRGEKRKVRGVPRPERATSLPSQIHAYPKWAALLAPN